MAYLFDTCALSELVAVKRDPHALERMLALPREEIFLSTITIGEIQRGIDEMVQCPRQHFLRDWLENHVLHEYSERIFLVDIVTARTWGSLSASMIQSGFKMQVKDSLIAATALNNSLTVVTRNEKDFAHCGVRVLNPWK